MRYARNAMSAAILSATVAGAGLLSPIVLHAQAAPAPAAKSDTAAKPEAPMDNQQTAVPIKQVVLYSSGVGYFEHFGTVKGNGATELRFKTAQINDILKSLILQDLDKGRIGVITYPSQDPIAKTLRSFQVDITANPSLAELLNQLRGAKVTLAGGTEKVTGTVLGVEKKPRPVGPPEGGKTIEVPFLNLITDAGIRSVPLDDVKSLVLEDKKLQEELTRALSALAGARDQDKKPVKIDFQGDGERRVRIGYVVETPVWKTSYRLVLADKAGGEKAGDAKTPNLGGSDAKDPAKAAAGKAAGGNGALQGWAIVENQTDNDWNDVQLSLVSGRPISFIQDLYQPLYVPRPVVQPELYASLRPQTYDAGMAGERKREQFGASAAEAEAASMAGGGGGGQPLVAKRSFDRAASNRPAAAPMAAAKSPAAGYMDQPMDATASVSSIASAAKVGELFQYTVGSVSLPRQTSAMIPVVTDAIEVERVSIYNMNVLAKNPLLGARVKNTTGKHLLQGPVTVLDAGAYAGDARIDDVPPGQERLVSYGVDQQVIVQAKNGEQRSSLVTGKLVKGVLQLTYKEVMTQEYAADNKSDKDKTLVFEHPRAGGDWKLVEPAKADETTDALYRFKGKVAAGKGTQLTVKQEWVRAEHIGIQPMDYGTIIRFSQAGELPKAVRDALVRAAQLKQAVVETQRQIQDRQAKVTAIGKEQSRLRDNMKAVPQNTDYYTRLLKKLDEQETTIEGLNKETAKLQEMAEKQQQALDEYANGLSAE